MLDEYGKRNSVFRRYRRWVTIGVFDAILETLSDRLGAAQHKEKTPRDPTIRAKFNTYRFADYKEVCILLLAKIATVNVETVAITKAMQALDRSDWG